MLQILIEWCCVVAIYTGKSSRPLVLLIENKDFRNLSESGQVALVQLAVKVVSLCSLSELRRMDSRPKGVADEALQLSLCTGILEI